MAESPIIVLGLDVCPHDQEGEGKRGNDVRRAAMTDRHQRGVSNVSSEGVEIGPTHKREKIDNMRMTGMCGDHERSCPFWMAPQERVQESSRERELKRERVDVGPSPPCD